MVHFILFVLIGLGAVLALVSAMAALGAYLRYRRARLELQGRLTDEVESLSRRTVELEKGLAALQVRSSELPVRISEIQHSLSTLQVLTDALAGSLRQAQKVLAYSVLRSPGDGRRGG